MREKTNIPVPKVLETGESAHGPFLTVERLDGIRLDDIHLWCCQEPVDGRLPDGHQLKKCSACQEMANQNASTFIRETPLPQLKALRSNVSGLNGTVTPPPWVTEYDRRETWKSKTSKIDDAFGFCHEDLGSQNVLMDPGTLLVSGVVDLENAGFYPDEFADQWSLDVKSYYDLYSDEDSLSQLVSLLE